MNRLIVSEKSRKLVRLIRVSLFLVQYGYKNLKQCDCMLQVNFLIVNAHLRSAKSVWYENSNEEECVLKKRRWPMPKQFKVNSIFYGIIN